jgi:isopentenyldiphosphate isomerase
MKVKDSKSTICVVAKSGFSVTATTTFTADTELFPVVNEQGETIGRASRRECHGGAKPLHPVVHLHVFDSGGKLYLQKRPLHKDTQPGKWDTSVGGHVNYGETISAALQRETEEELNISDFKPQFVARYVFESEVEKELVNTYRTVYEGVITPNHDELDGGRFWSIDEIKANLGKGVFTPNFEKEFQKYISQCNT